MKLNHETWKKISIVLAIVTLLIASNFYQTHRDLKTLKEGLYSYEFTAQVIDSTTGETITNVITHFPTSSSDDIIWQSSGCSSLPGGVLEIRGIAYQPRKFGFSADGYNQGFVWINSDTKPTFIVKLSPK